jgi:putative flippase GtrA
MALVDADLYARVRRLMPEMLKFGVVGGIGAVFDLGGAALLHGKYHVEPLMAKGISTATAMVITYLGSRFWTFKDRDNQELRREAGLFIVLNLVGLLIAEAVVGIFTYVLGLHGQLAYNFASFLGTGFGTIFRYVTYRKWVFPAADQNAAATAAPAPRPFPDYPPWELDPTFLGTPLAAVAPAPLGAPVPVPAPTYSSPWGQEAATAWDPAVAPTMSWSAPALRAASAPLAAPAPQAAPWPPPPPPTTPLPEPPPPVRRPVLRSSGGGRHRKS